MTDPMYQLLALLDDMEKQGTNPNDELYNYFCKTDKVQLGKCLARLERVRSYEYEPSSAKGTIKRIKRKSKKERQGKQSRLKGLLLEKAVQILLDGCKVFTYQSNIRSTTSEIDFLIKVEPFARYFQPFNNGLSHILGEAKCYDSSLKKEWVDELVGTLAAHNTNFGILFTGCPPRKVQREFRSAIALHSMRGQSIVPFGRAQLDKIKNGENFLKLLSQQSLQARVHNSELSV